MEQVRKEIFIPKQVVSSKTSKQFMPGDKVHVGAYDDKHKWVEGAILKPVDSIIYDVSTGGGTITRNATYCWPKKSGSDSSISTSVDQTTNSPVSESGVGSHEHLSAEVAFQKVANSLTC